MNPSEYNALHILHVLGAIGLVAVVFYACVAPATTRKAVLTWSGIFATIMVLTGIRMWQGLYQWHANWVWVKILCWFAIAALAGLPYRKPGKAKLWIVLSLVFATLALVMVYVKPF